MKKTKTFWPVHFLLLLAGCIGYATAAPYGPDGRQTKYTQPNGQVLELRVFGNNNYGRTETPKGFTVVFNAADSTYYYAKLSQDAKSLIPMATRADQPAPADLEPHVDLPVAQIKEIATANDEKYLGSVNKRWKERVKSVRIVRKTGGAADLTAAEAAAAKIQAAPITGARRGLTLLVQFPKDPATGGGGAIDFPTDRDKIVRFCNGVGYTENGNTGSVRDYIYDQSLGLLDYSQTVTEIVTVPRPRNYYNYADYPSNRTLSNTASDRLIKDAVNALIVSGFDFSGLTTDENNYIIATNVFFAGPDSGVFAQGLWPQSGPLSSPISVGSPGSPKFVSRFQITNIEDAAPVIGTFLHENGHLLLGYPDIYAFPGNGEGVGEHCLMGSGNYLNGGKTPAPLNAYFKDIVGWGNIVDISPKGNATVDLPTTGNVAYRLTNPNAPTEYFLVENRGDGDKWAQYADDKGIMIWHIDETIDGNFRIGNNHYGIALEQADGNYDLEAGKNRGDSGDLFDLSRSTFKDSSNPNANWWDGSKSSVDVEVVSGLGKNTSVTFGGIAPNTIIVTSPNGGEVLFKDSIYPITWKSNVQGSVVIDLYRSGKFFKNISPSEPSNGGVFDWFVPANYAGFSNYTIKISSQTNPTPVFDFSDGTFAVTKSGFPEGNAVPEGWFKPGFAKTIWRTTTNNSFEGKYSLVSGDDTPDGKASAIAYRSSFNAGYVSFYIKVSSERSFDFARFYIDGVPQSFSSGGTGRGISGTVDWTFYRFLVPAGKHTLVWSYEKDDSFAGRMDSAWIDGVSLPPGTQDILVRDPDGKKLVNSASIVNFPDTLDGATTRPVTFTISNRGKADLTGLKINTIGKNPNDFTVRNLGATTLKAGESATFEVLFSPSEQKLRKAKLRILSNDPDEGKFDIQVQGIGFGPPPISIFQPADTALADKDVIDFASAQVGSDGKIKTFTIFNPGTEILYNLEIVKKGPEKGDFKVGSLGSVTLFPGDSTTFKVLFHPTELKSRNAVLLISSNDIPGIFSINLTGKGTARIRAALGSGSVPQTFAQAVLDPVFRNTTSASSTSVEVVDGMKYLALTVTKDASSSPIGVVEVSSDLLDWYSGNNFTVTLINDASILKVRDKTPVTQDSKRYIRLK